jgi:hypothetical protein
VGIFSGRETLELLNYCWVKAGLRDNENQENAASGGLQNFNDWFTLFPEF